MKKVISLILCIVFAVSLTACGQEKKEETPVELTNANVYVISGPTGMGAVNLMEKSANNETTGKYTFNVSSTPDEVVSKLSTKEADIAAVATNLAAKLYQKTGGEITVLCVNTYGVLGVLTNGNNTVTSMADLKGKTVYTTGQGANPEYIINYLLNKNGIDPKNDVNIQFVAEGTELVGVWGKDPNAIIIAPQPVASSITVKYEGSSVALDLTDEWKKVAGDSALMMGCIVVRNDYLNDHKAEVDNFLSEYKQSVEAANSDADTTANLCEKYGIVPKAAIAKKALPNCNLCYVTGSEMKTQLSGYLSVLLDADKTSIGGQLPANSFYYAG